MPVPFFPSGLLPIINQKFIVFNSELNILNFLVDMSSQLCYLFHRKLKAFNRKEGDVGEFRVPET